MIKTVAKILQNKGHEVYSVAPEATVYQALEIMAEKEVGALVVLEKGKVVGIFSERDYARSVELQGLESRTTLVRQVMTEMLHYITPEKSVEDGMSLVTESHCRHLPVLKDNELIGLVSIGDLVKASLAEKDFVIKQLKSYIKGK
ncbi:MAG TPA: CBS domain-containing protein [Desulfuromonadales bacterium]|nr:CBS domain-containing protein [Desulfuromonadales bacterium]